MPHSCAAWLILNEKGGENMYSILSNISRYKAVLSVLTVMVMALALAPAGAALAQQSAGSFGLNEFNSNIALNTNQNLQVTIAKVINIILSFLGIVAVIIILIGGFKWMTAGGESEGIEEAKKIIMAGVIGLAIVLSSYAIAKFVLGSLSGATGTGTLAP